MQAQTESICLFPIIVNERTPALSHAFVHPVIQNPYIKPSTDSRIIIDTYVCTVSPIYVLLYSINYMTCFFNHEQVRWFLLLVQQVIFIYLMYALLIPPLAQFVELI